MRDDTHRVVVQATKTNSRSVRQRRREGFQRTPCVSMSLFSEYWQSCGGEGRVRGLSETKGCGADKSLILLIRIETNESDLVVVHASVSKRCGSGQKRYRYSSEGAQTRSSLEKGQWKSSGAKRFRFRRSLGQGYLLTEFFGPLDPPTLLDGFSLQRS